MYTACSSFLVLITKQPILFHPQFGHCFEMASTVFFSFFQALEEPWKVVTFLSTIVWTHRWSEKSERARSLLSFSCRWGKWINNVTRVSVSVLSYVAHDSSQLPFDLTFVHIFCLLYSTNENCQTDFRNFVAGICMGNWSLTRVHVSGTQLGDWTWNIGY